MFSKLSEKLVQTLIRRGQLGEGERELYVYGFFILFSELFYILLTGILGLCLHIPIQALLFFAVFRPLRQYAGGFHNKTELRCLLFSSAVILGNLFALKWMQTADLDWVILLPVLLGTIPIVIFSPLDTTQKPLEPSERKHFRKRTLWCLFAADAVFAVSFALGLRFLFLPIGLAVGLAALFLSLGVVRRVLDRKRAGEPNILPIYKRNT